MGFLLSITIHYQWKFRQRWKIPSCGHITLSVHHQVTGVGSLWCVSVGSLATAYGYTSMRGLCGTEHFPCLIFFVCFQISCYMSVSVLEKYSGLGLPFSGKATSINKKYRYYLNIRKSFTIALGQWLLRDTLPMVKHLILISPLKWILFVVCILTKWEDQMIL